MKQILIRRIKEPKLDEAAAEGLRFPWKLPMPMCERYWNVTGGFWRYTVCLSGVAGQGSGEQGHQKQAQNRQSRPDDHFGLIRCFDGKE